MATDFNEVVSQWYDELHDSFVGYLSSRFKGLTTDDIEDIYGETFLCAHDNLQRGMVAPDTNWKSYLLRIGINQAIRRAGNGQRWVHEPDAGDGDDGEVAQASRRWDNCVSLSQMVDDTEGLTDSEKERMLGVMNGIMAGMTEPCRTILPDFYYGNMSLEEIRQQIGYSTVNAVKTQRYKCFDRLKRAVRQALDHAGLSPF